MEEVFVPIDPDEPIGVVALSGPTDPGRLDRGLEVLRSTGREVIEAPNLRSRRAYLAGSDEERVAGLHAVLDRGARILWAARGGYGATRILGRLPWDEMARRSVVLIGYSDLTAVLNPLAERSGVVQLHGPVVTELIDPHGDAVLRVLELLEGRLSGGVLFEIDQHQVVRPGRARGRAFGGNLSILAALAGTSWAPRNPEGLLFIEDVAEPAYRLDRLLTQLRDSGILSSVKALISGNLYKCESVETVKWRRLLVEAVPPGIPVVEGLPFGHGSDHRAFPVGAEVELDTDLGTLLWRR